MSRLLRAAAACVALAGFAPRSAPAQFAQPKIRYERFDWRTYKSPHFDVYYYPEEEAFLEQMVSFAESAYLQISEYLDHQLPERVPLIYYKTHPEFEQTNILLAEIPEAVGAFAEPALNRIVIPIDEPPDKVYAVLTHELVHIFEYSILFENNLGRAIRSNPPIWIMEGLASFIGRDEDNFDRMVIRDAVINSIVPGLQELGGLSFLNYRFGNAVFTFIESRWGRDGVRNFLYEYRKVLLTNNIPKAIKEAFGMDIVDFDREFQQYLRRRYLPALLEKEEPSRHGREIGFKNPGVFTFAPTVSPGGGLIAVLANRSLELDLWILSGADGEPIRNITKGFTNEYDHLVAEVFSGKRDLGWSPTDDRIAVFARRENRRVLLIHDARTGRELNRIDMPGLALQASPSFSPDGRRIAFAGNRAGVYDIYSYNLDTGEILNHTDDEFVDSNPVWSADGSAILYNRRIGAHEKIFTVSATDPGRKQQLTFGPSSDIMPAYSRDGKWIYYSSDRNGGLFNLHALDLASGEERQLTDVMTGAFAPVEMDVLGDKRVVVFTAYYQGRYRLFRMELEPAVLAAAPLPRDLKPIELEPFHPKLELTLDEAEKHPYARKWDLEIPSLEVGVTDDGTFFGNSFVSVTDLLGDNRWLIGVATISNFSQLDVYRLYLARRNKWIYHAYQYEDFYFFPSGTVNGVVVLDRIEQRVSGGEAGVQIPFNRNHSFEGSLGASDWSIPFFEQVTDNFGNVSVQLRERDFRALDIGAFFSGDSARFQAYGPFHGQRYRVGATYSPSISGDPGTTTEYRADYRKYFKMTRRSSFAYRLVGIVSNSRDTEFRRVYSAGGLNTIRGYDFRVFQGDRVFFQNLELRFPLVDRLQLPFGGFTDIRGLLFLDVGGAYFRGGAWLDPVDLVYHFPGDSIDENGDPCLPGGGAQCRDGSWDFWDSKESRLRDGAASYGLGLNFRLGILELNWVFAKRTDLGSGGSSDGEDRWRSAFYIGNKF